LRAPVAQVNRRYPHQYAKKHLNNRPANEDKSANGKIMKSLDETQKKMELGIVIILPFNIFRHGGSIRFDYVASLPASENCNTLVPTF
jgi:hypothetical protein